MDETLKNEILKLIEENNHQDVLELGVPSKGGRIKIYLDYNKPEQAQSKIENAITARNHAKNQIR